MVGAGHLHSWTVYAKVYISYYSKRPTDQFRGPNVVEAEEADKVAMFLCASLGTGRLHL